MNRTTVTIWFVTLLFIALAITGAITGHFGFAAFLLGVAVLGGLYDFYFRRNQP